MKAIIKTLEELKTCCTTETICGFHFKGQFFPNENLIYCGKEFEFTESSSGVYTTEINGNYKFFSIDALNVIKQ